MSASRCIDILEFLSVFPEREFTLSEIVRETSINVSSCHSILLELTDRGYLIRAADKKSYTLGPSLIAAGQAGLRSQPIVEQARLAAEDLHKELGFAVMFCAAVGGDSLAVFSVEDSQGRVAGMRAGERLPMVAPTGTVFMAWENEAAIAAWIARRSAPVSPALAEEWRQDLKLTRERGYVVTLRASAGKTIASQMAEMAHGRRVVDYKDEVLGLIHSLDNHLRQPERFDDDRRYDVTTIMSPVFDKSGKPAFSFCLGGFPELLTGAEVDRYANRLMRACLEIMRTDRPVRRR